MLFLLVQSAYEDSKSKYQKQTQNSEKNALTQILFNWIVLKTPYCLYLMRCNDTNHFVRTSHPIQMQHALLLWLFNVQFVFKSSTVAITEKSTQLKQLSVAKLYNEEKKLFGFNQKFLEINFNRIFSPLGAICTRVRFILQAPMNRWRKLIRVYMIKFISIKRKIIFILS